MKLRSRNRLIREGRKAGAKWEQLSRFEYACNALLAAGCSNKPMFAFWSWSAAARSDLRPSQPATFALDSPDFAYRHFGRRRSQRIQSHRLSFCRKDGCSILDFRFRSPLGAHKSRHFVLSFTLPARL